MPRTHSDVAGRPLNGDNPRTRHLVHSADELQQSRRTLAAALVRFNGPANWSLAGDTPKLQRFFAAQFGRALPISAFGQTAVHDRMEFDHRHAVDVAVHPGSTSGVHIHVGQASPRLTVRR